MTDARKLQGDKLSEAEAIERVAYECGEDLAREGAYLLRTNLQTDTAEQLWAKYMQLTEAEASFRGGADGGAVARFGGRAVHRR